MIHAHIPLEYQSDYLKMERYCAGQEHCSFDIKRKLSDKNIPEDIVLLIIQLLEEKKFIDHNRYCEAFTNDHVKLKKWGRQKIKAALRAKNLPSGCIEKSLNHIDDKEYQSNLKALYTRKHQELEKEKDLHKKKAKIIRYLASNGYELELIYSLFN